MFHGEQLKSLRKPVPNPHRILVIDLDGTLIKSDMLHETFWSALSKNWKTPFKAVGALLSGKEKLKSFLSFSSEVDFETLPYNNTVIEYIKNHRNTGGHTTLVTASNQAIAIKIAEHLELFDEVHGSSESVNLKGQSKAEFLKDRFGVKNYDYIGDSSADIPIWKGAEKAITVNANSSLKKACMKINPNCEHLKTNSFTRSLLSYGKAIRPHHWLKNVLVFLPMLAAHQITNEHLANSILAFFAFSLIASSVYITNDLLDLKADRVHPRKKNRPFASGAIPISDGIVIAPLLFFLGISLSFFAETSFWIVLLAYYALTSAYSLFIKRKTIIDIFTLAGLYTIRIIGGGVATEIEVSFWLLAFSIFIFLSLAAVKRQAELVDLNKREQLQIVGRGYHVDDLPIVSMIAASTGFMSVLVIALYINSPEVLALYPTPSMLWGVCCISLYWLMRMIFITHRGQMHDDPIIYAIRDRVSQLSLISIIVLIMLGATA